MGIVSQSNELKLQPAIVLDVFILTDKGFISNVNFIIIKLFWSLKELFRAIDSQPIRLRKDYSMMTPDD